VAIQSYATCFQVAAGKLDAIVAGQVLSLTTIASSPFTHDLTDISSNSHFGMPKVAGVYQQNYQVRTGERTSNLEAPDYFINSKYKSWDLIHPNLIAIIYNSLIVDPEGINASMNNFTGRVRLFSTCEVPDFLCEKPLAEIRLAEETLIAALDSDVNLGDIRDELDKQITFLTENMNKFGFTRQELGCLLRFQYRREQCE